MIAKAIRAGLEYTVEISHENQAFRLDYHGSLDECEWMARMFMVALDRHDVDLIEAQK